MRTKRNINLVKGYIHRQIYFDPCVVRYDEASFMWIAEFVFVLIEIAFCFLITVFSFWIED